VVSGRGIVHFDDNTVLHLTPGTGVSGGWAMAQTRRSYAQPPPPTALAAQWIVPAGQKHFYEVLEPLRAVEAYGPLPFVHDRDGRAILDGDNGDPSGSASTADGRQG